MVCFAGFDWTASPLHCWWASIYFVFCVHSIEYISIYDQSSDRHRIGSMRRPSMNWAIFLDACGSMWPTSNTEEFLSLTFTAWNHHNMIRQLIYRGITWTALRWVLHNFNSVGLWTYHADACGSALCKWRKIQFYFYWLVLAECSRTTTLIKIKIRLQMIKFIENFWRYWWRCQRLCRARRWQCSQHFNDRLDID